MSQTRSVRDRPALNEGVLAFSSASSFQGTGCQCVLDILSSAQPTERARSDSPPVLYKHGAIHYLYAPRATVGGALLRILTWYIFDVKLPFVKDTSYIWSRLLKKNILNHLLMKCEPQKTRLKNPLEFGCWGSLVIKVFKSQTTEKALILEQ